MGRLPRWLCISTTALGRLAVNWCRNFRYFGGTMTDSSVSETVAALKGIPTREDLMELLRKEVVEVTFTKLNGDERVMPCTLIESYLPPAKKDEPLTQKKIREISD